MRRVLLQCEGGRKAWSEATTAHTLSSGCASPLLIRGRKHDRSGSNSCVFYGPPSLENPCQTSLPRTQSTSTEHQLRSGIRLTPRRSRVRPLPRPPNKSRVRSVYARRCARQFLCIKPPKPPPGAANDSPMFWGGAKPGSAHRSNSTGHSRRNFGEKTSHRASPGLS